MAYSELIKDFSRIRSYMRSFYVYGFRHRNEYDEKSTRGYDNERRRIESWLGNYMSFGQDSDGKRTFLSVDSRAIPHNPLYRAFRAKSFTGRDIMLHFYLLDILTDEEGLSITEIMDEYNGPPVKTTHDDFFVSGLDRGPIIKVRYCRSFNECANTNLQAVFELILRTAVENRLPQEELPSTLYIVSDMEFDNCACGASLTNFAYAKKLYEANGYCLPQVVFWNVQSRNEQQPVKMNEQGVALVSGCTPRIFSQVMNGEMEPYQNMLNVLMSKRYAVIAA